MEVGSWSGLPEFSTALASMGVVATKGVHKRARAMEDTPWNATMGCMTKGSKKRAPDGADALTSSAKKKLRVQTVWVWGP